VIPGSAGVVTILTDPIPTELQYFEERLKKKVRPLLRRVDGKPPLQKPRYGGHFAVTRSLIEGLQKANIPFVYNPQREKDCTERVIVLAGINTLVQAIALRKSGIIKKLAAGPNIVTYPGDSPDVVGSPCIDRYIVNSNWTKTLYALDLPELEPKLIIWPAGVDEQFWKPVGLPKHPRSMLFYAKRPERKLLEDCRQIAVEAGFEVTILKYGTYVPTQYKDLLDRNSVMVHFVEQESQGISLCEAWSMDVPTLVWNPGFFFWQGHNVVSSSAPYLSKETGAFFRDAVEFKGVLRQLISHSFQFSPRKWVLENQTDERSAQHLMDLLDY
jgi:hypothetical protein